MEPIFNVPLGKPRRKTIEPAPLTVPSEMPVERPVPVKVPVPA